MKISIIRGQYLNKFEMQNFEPLKDRHEITVYKVHSNKFNVDSIDMPVKELHSIEEISNVFVGPLKHCSEKLICKFGLENYIFGLERALKGIDIVHVAEMSTRYSYQVIKLKGKLKFKVVATIWENIPYKEECFIPYVRGLTHRKCMIRDGVDRFIAVTEKTKSTLLLEGVSEDKIQVIYPGVNLEKFKPADKDKTLLRKLVFSDGDLIVLFIGRLVWEKGIYDLLLSAKEVINDFSLSVFSPKFLFIGEGPEYETFIKMLNELEMTQYCKVIENIEYGEIHYFYNLADIFVLPSKPTKIWQEQFGMVLVEAMASGLPVVSTFCGAIPEVVGDTGLLVPPGDFTALYHAIKKLMIEKSLREELSRKARERAEKKFDAIRCAEEINGVYHKLSE